jgi:hypothetical protein
MISQVQALHRQLADVMTAAGAPRLNGLTAGQRATAAAGLEGASETLVAEIDTCPAEAELPDFCTSCRVAADRSFELHELHLQLAATADVR